MTPTLTWSDDNLESIYRWTPGTITVHKYNDKGKEIDTFELKFDDAKSVLHQVHMAVCNRIAEATKARVARPTMTSAEYAGHNGSKCPFCKSTNLEGERLDADMGIAWQEIQCLDCKRTWRDEYVLTGYTTYLKEDA